MKNGNIFSLHDFALENIVFSMPQADIFSEVMLRGKHLEDHGKVARDQNR
jgi:hypothetical protein